MGCVKVSDPKKQVLVKVGSEMITEQNFVDSLIPKEKENYLKFKKLRGDEFVAKKLLEQEAKKRKMSLPDLLSLEVHSKVNVADEEIRAFYKKNEKKYKGKKHEEWNKEITLLLRTQKNILLAKKLLSEIARRTEIKYYLPAR